MADSEFNPLEGDRYLVSSKAQHYKYIAEAIARSVTTLNKIAEHGGMTSKAVDAVRELSRTVADDISKAQARYSKTADALITYSSKLGDAQDAADTAISHIDSKSSSLTTARNTRRTVMDTAHHTQQPEDAAKLEHWNGQVEDAQVALAGAQQEWREALAAKNSAAKTAIGEIVEVLESKQAKELNDSWWDDWGATLFKALKTICQWAGVLSLVLGWVPILGQILIVLAAIGAVMELVEAIVKAVAGDGSWTDVLWAAGGAVLTLFGGKLLAMAGTRLRALKIVNSGRKGRAAVSRLQGIAKDSPKFMSRNTAKSILKKPLWKSFESPFARTKAQEALFTQFQRGKISFADAFKQSAKEAFPGFKPSLEKGLGINSDFANYLKMSIADRSLGSIPMAITATGCAAYQGYKIYGLADGFTPFDLPKFSDGGYGSAAGAGKSTIDLVGSIADVQNTGTSR